MSQLTHWRLLVYDSRDLKTDAKKHHEHPSFFHERNRTVAATNKELQFDWIMRSPNARHSTGAFHGLIDGRHPASNECTYSNLETIFSSNRLFAHFNAFFHSN